MAREYVELLDSSAQDSFNTLADTLDLSDVVSMLIELGVDDGKIRGAVYGWAIDKAGLI